MKSVDKTLTVRNLGEDVMDCIECEKITVDLNGKTIFITGAIGFIGANLIRRLLRELN